MKPWYQSKIVWLGVITTLMGVLPLVAGFIDTQSVNDPAAWITLVIGILTVVSRVWFTDTQIEK